MTKKELINIARNLVGEFTLSRSYMTAGSVAAALLTKAGNVYTGICIDLACGIGFCAEHSAVAEMLKNRETETKMIVAVTKDRILPPCGRCRELLMQVNTRNQNTVVLLSEKRGMQLRHLLPDKWF
jgi:cytidine deaminase